MRMVLGYFWGEGVGFLGSSILFFSCGVIFFLRIFKIFFLKVLFFFAVVGV